MRCARAHYVHVVCTSGHPLWQCCKQPIIYSTLISTHVNPHQSSRAWGYCCGRHTASWQSHLRKMKGHSWAWFEPAITPGRSRRKGCNQLSLSELIKKSQKIKVNRHKLLGHRGSVLPLVLKIHLRKRTPLLLKSPRATLNRSWLSYKYAVRQRIQRKEQQLSCALIQKTSRQYMWHDPVWQHVHLHTRNMAHVLL